MAARPRVKRRSSDLTTRLVVLFLSVVVIVMVLANVWILWPSENRPDNSDVSVLSPSSRMQSSSSGKLRHDDKSTTTTNKIVDIFRQAGVELDASEIRDLPTWDEIVDLVGDEPIVYGLDTCAAFRTAIPAVERNLGSAGMFNTGTNLVTQLLKENCKIPERVQKYGMTASREAHGIRWQVSWGKHTQQKFKWDHATDHAKDIDKESILPVVVVRNPYSWMASMCRNGYTAKWPHTPRNCPHLVGKTRRGHVVDRNMKPVSVNVTYAKHKTTQHDSLAHLWNDWYNDYLRVDYPRLVVRFEDLIFHSNKMTKLICECAGGELQTPFKYIVNPAKTGPGHGKRSERTGMVQAWIKYGKPLPARGGFSKTDYYAAQQYLDSDIMNIFGYSHPPAER